jgi:hypothetical protein
MGKGSAKLNMKRETVPYDKYLDVEREAEAMRQFTNSEAWEIIKKDLEQQKEQIENQLSNNRLRTVHRTVATSDGNSETHIITAETQIAENAGMYKMIQRFYDFVETVMHAPAEIQKAAQEGLLSIEEPPKKAN